MTILEEFINSSEGSPFWVITRSIILAEAACLALAVS